MSMLCPCYSQRNYRHCCEPFHKQKKIPETAVELMRSRYSAYAMGLADYIISTTHPHHPSYSENKDLWKKQIIAFSEGTKFADLKILDFSSEEDIAYVTFHAILFQGSKDVSFKEKSCFLKEKGRWFYYSGMIQ